MASSYESYNPWPVFPRETLDDDRLKYDPHHHPAGGVLSGQVEVRENADQHVLISSKGVSDALLRLVVDGLQQSRPGVSALELGHTDNALTTSTKVLLIQS